MPIETVEPTPVAAIRPGDTIRLAGVIYNVTDTNTSRRYVVLHLDRHPDCPWGPDAPCEQRFGLAEDVLKVVADEDTLGDSTFVLTSRGATIAEINGESSATYTGLIVRPRPRAPSSQHTLAPLLRGWRLLRVRAQVQTNSRFVVG